ncbi:unnamed protein product [Adineta ricciae]|uniref:Apple domain-containing protein n=1 Tax=Adineta ricciae TaxID=249248 RepID=A0A814YSQ8_ADIRI|nr:unnamed protein product [Adineta ricciae]
MLIWFILAAIHTQLRADEYQSLFNISDLGQQFSPVNQQALLLSNISADSSSTCRQACHANIYCWIYDYDGLTKQCRLFEGDVSTMGIISASSSPLSTVGQIQLNKELFASSGLSCSFCAKSRYLTCVNSTCQCLARTYFDGSMCRSQKLLSTQCTSETDCRNDLNLTCLSRKQCGPISLQSGITVAGSSNGSSGSTSNALLSPFGIAIGRDDSLWISDAGNSRVMRVSVGSLNGTIVAGTGTSGIASTQLNFPSHLFVDNASNIYVSDTLNGRVMLWLNGSSSGFSATGATRIAGRTIGLAVDSQKNVYVAETDNHRVTKWTPNATTGIVVAGASTVGTDNQHLAYPFGLFLDELHSYLYVADYGNNRIQRFTLGGSLNGTTVAGGSGQGSNDSQLYFPQAVCVSKNTGAIYVADTYNNRVVRWSSGATKGVTLVGVPGTSATLLSGPGHVALSRNETFLYVADVNNNRIQRFELI